MSKYMLVLIFLLSTLYLAVQLTDVILIYMALHGCPWKFIIALATIWGAWGVMLVAGMFFVKHLEWKD